MGNKRTSTAPLRIKDAIKRPGRLRALAHKRHESMPMLISQGRHSKNKLLRQEASFAYTLQRIRNKNY